MSPINSTHYAKLHPQNGDRIVTTVCRDVTSPCIYGHVARLDDVTPANMALQLHINVSLNRPPDRTCMASSSTEQVARPATKRFRPSDWRALEACCRPWTRWCNDATALAGYAGCSSRVVSASDCGVTLRTQVRITPRTVVFIATATVIYSLEHGLRTFTTVPRSTQPSTLSGTVK